jgi:hypothetical protein
MGVGGVWYGIVVLEVCCSIPNSAEIKDLF